MRLTQHRYQYGIFGSRGLASPAGNAVADKLLRFIRDYISQSGGVAPSFEEMVEGIGIRSKGHVSKLVRKLEADGKIRCLHGKARAMEIVRAEQYFKVERIDGQAELLPMRLVRAA